MGDDQIQKLLPKEAQSGDPTNADKQKNDQTNRDVGGVAVDDSKQSKKSRFSRVLIVRILLFAPYAVGILWTSLHPIVSVVTGEAKCRGWYLDEHSIETRFTAGKNMLSTPDHLHDLESVEPLRIRTTQHHRFSLCDFLPREGDPGFNDRNLVCHRHGDYFEMAMIMPLSNAIDATEEAVVLVFPRPIGKLNDWKSSNFHKAVVRSIVHLADPIETPWLAKAVLVVTPTMNDINNDDDDDDDDGNDNHKTLEDTVSAFLDAHSGRQTLSQDYQRRRNPSEQHPDEERIPQLPLRLSGSILRNLVVIDVHRDEDSPSTTIVTGKKKKGTKTKNTDISILPQGRRGVLPNADLVFLVGKLLEKTVSFKMAETKTFLAHAYTRESKIAGSWIDGWLERWKPAADHSKLAKKWAQGLVDVGLFARTMALGPFPPHAPALERGIDSLTIRASFGGTFVKDPAVEIVQHTEHIVRALANLHERLHHSFPLYLLPTPKAFVSHIEYLLPNILVLLPLAVRVFGILLPSMTRGLDLTAVGGILLVVFVVVVAMALLPSSSSSSVVTSWLVVLYTGVGMFWVRTVLFRNQHRGGSNDKDRQRFALQTTRTVLTLQYVTCALAVYFLVPIAFAHVSLAYLPSVVWTPLFAFPDYPSLKEHATNGDTRRGRGGIRWTVTIAGLCLLGVVTASPVYLVPGVFSSYTPFVRYVHVPLHVLFVLLITSVVVS